MKDYIEHLELYGDGGTDFRPAFEWVDKLLEQHEFHNLKAVSYTHLDVYKRQQHNREITAGRILHTDRNIHATGSETMLLVLHRTCTYSFIGENITVSYTHLSRRTVLQPVLSKQIQKKCCFMLQKETLRKL